MEIKTTKGNDNEKSYKSVLMVMKENWKKNIKKKKKGCEIEG